MYFAPEVFKREHVPPKKQLHAIVKALGGRISSDRRGKDATLRIDVGRRGGGGGGGTASEAYKVELILNAALTKDVARDVYRIA